MIKDRPYDRAVKVTVIAPDDINGANVQELAERICFNRRKVNLRFFADQKGGIKQLSERIWLVTFMDHDLGYFDDTECRMEPLESAFGPKVLPKSPE